MADQLYVPGNVRKNGADATNSTTDSEELLRKHAEETPTSKSVATAFLIFQDESGAWAVSNDITIDIAPARPAALHDMYAGCVSIADELSAVKTAQHVNQLMMTQAKAMQDQLQNQQLLSKLHTGNRLR